MTGTLSGSVEFPHAFSPFTMNRSTARNRVFVAAHGTNFPQNGAPSQRYIDYLAARSHGGAGLVMTEAMHVHPTSGGPYMIDMWRPSAQPQLQRLTDAVHDGGALIFAQIMHVGRQGEPVMTGLPTMGSSPLQDPAHTSIPHELTKPEIRELVQAFADAAAVAAQTGFDGVEMSCSHGYLIEQFLSPYANQRQDEYGGSTQNRLRFAREIMRAVLDRVGSELVVGARINAFEIVPGGFDAEEGLEIIGSIANEGVHFVSVTAGQHASPLMVVPPAGIPTLPFRDNIAAVRKVVDCAVFASHRVRRIADVEEAIASGLADMVSMARAHIADPEIVNKTAQGRADEVRPCIGCVQGCRGQLMSGLPIGCLVNPRAGREGMYVEKSAAQTKRVAVIGGGIAGMQFASTAASRGHEVTLFERSDHLGGRFEQSASLPDRAELARFTDELQRELIRNNVTVKVGHTATSEQLADYHEVIIATGAVRAETDPHEWPDAGVPVIGLDEALTYSPRDGERILILDRGDHHNIAILLALKYGRAGAIVVILDPTGTVARKLDALNKFAMTRDFATLAIRMASNVKNFAINGGAVSFEHEGWNQELATDRMVVLEPARPAARGQFPTDAIYLGDADTPGLGVEIIHTAYVTALNI